MNGVPVLKIEDLHTFFFSRSKQAFIRSVNGVSFTISKGETLGVVGESGSGKSITAMSVMGLISAAPGIVSGNIEFYNDSSQKKLLRNLAKFVKVRRQNGRIIEVRKDHTGWQKHTERVMRHIRGKEIAMIFQDPKASLNPYITVGKQITESILLNTEITNKQEAKDRALYWLDQVKIDSPGLRYNNHPYGLSGGMCQRAMIAMALASEPALLIADEPTTGLDATIQSKLVDLLVELKNSLQTTSMLISHDIDVMRRLADRIVVMYGGTVLEHGAVKDILSSEYETKHPYTAALLASIPDPKNIREKGALQAIEGDVLDTISIPEGCRFYGRCNRVTETVREKCAHHEPPIKEIAPGHSMRCWLYYD